MKLKLAAVGLVIAAGVGAMTLSSPSYGIQDMGDWGTVTEDSIGIISTAWVDNTIYGIETDAVDLRYTIAMNGIPVARGNRSRISLQTGNNTVEVRTVLSREPLPRWWASHVRGGERTEMTATIDGSVQAMGRSVPVPSVSYSKPVPTDLIGMMDTALNRTQGTYRFSDTVVSPEISITEARAGWGPVTVNETGLDIFLTIQNPNAYPLPVPGFAGGLRMADTVVADWDSSTTTVIQQPQDGVIPPGSSQEVGFRVRLDNHRVIDWLATHIRQDEQSQGALRWRFAFDVQGARFTLPARDEIRCPFTITTAILVDGQSSNVTRQQCSYGGGISGSDGDGSAQEGDSAGSDGIVGGGVTGSDDAQDGGSGSNGTTDNSTGDDGGVLDPVL